jgi:hypothetical protein
MTVMTGIIMPGRDHFCCTMKPPTSRAFVSPSGNKNNNMAMEYDVFPEIFRHTQFS